MSDRPPKKKMKKFLNTPLRINAVFDRLVAFPRKRGLRSLVYAITAGGVNRRA